MLVHSHFSSANFSVRGWVFVVRGNRVYDRISGPRHRCEGQAGSGRRARSDDEFVLPFRCRLDVGISAAVGAAAQALPHGLVLDRGDLALAHPCGQRLPEPTLGLVGQTFSSASPRRGATDVYPSEGRFKTTAIVSAGLVDCEYCLGMLCGN